ncbi:MAG: ATP-grasp domain-containing protein [Pirellulaceae bacterium]|nr:ATP-grasp domain-containing protein [Pirellulaceae bacterium]
MRIFVGEYVCGGGLASEAIDQIPDSLRLEGEAMLRAIVSDLSKFAETVVAADPRLGLEIDATETFAMDPGQPIWAQWIEAAKGCDSALIVAPEGNGVLAKGVAMLRAGGVDVIAGSGDFLRVGSDKLQTAKVLLAAGISHPLTMTLSDRRCEKKLAKCDRFVVKPRDGCGTQDIQIIDSFQDACDELTENRLLQAWIPGRPISVALVASGKQQTFLPAVGQDLDAQSHAYAGGCGPLDDDSQRRAMALASRTIAAMPPTARGFVGIDLLLGDRPSEDYVVEVNPRLTTSYVGLRQMIKGNLAARLFDIETGPVVCTATAESIRWTSDGRIWVNDVVADHA